MPKSMQDFVRDLVPSSTILFFGAGASIPSGGPSADDLVDFLSKKFNQPKEDFSLAEITELIEKKTANRRGLIESLQPVIRKAKPAGGLLNLPIFEWKAIYTTNYDTVIEQAFTRRSVPIRVIASSFDFSEGPNRSGYNLYKIHGTIDQDTSLNNRARMILTTSDYQNHAEYREHIYRALNFDIVSSHLVIVGYSLSDAHIKEIIEKAAAINASAMVSGRITLLMFQSNLDRASLYEGRGFSVVFGSVDEFFAALVEKSPGPLFSAPVSDRYVESSPILASKTLDVVHQLESIAPRIDRMFNGWPASYADIESRCVFDRDVASRVYQYHKSASGRFSVVLGASGVGKTTACRQAMLLLKKSGYICWEHNDNFSLNAAEWIKVARELHRDGKKGALFVDNAYSQLRALNEIFDACVSENLSALQIICASSRNNWMPRIKSPNLFKAGKEFIVSKLSDTEIERLIQLTETNSTISKLIEASFSGFSHGEKFRRLQERCEADMFVCMRNIFASEKFDDIILREFAELNESNQDIYRHVAVLERAGIKVHRQLIIRLLGLNMIQTASILDGLADIILEYSIDERNHVYGWRGRHPVISDIVAKYKYNNVQKMVDLYEKFIESVVSSQEIEIKSINDLCTMPSGIAAIPDRSIQNRLLRKIISKLPGERVPRHRLIRNLIDMKRFEEAETEIRIFEKDFRRGFANIKL